ncbi:hypothetical protein GH714_027595 [Hevea brasiliensis]|uniref:PGG domain-containing protein n=1 Tax=Hevea brasiliensis TaxID=3981 RepID=A0A6A6N2Y2_HEVBR|nr:hypothetical protein GH714_027595 [Hevea brasiliensis]
MKLYKAAISGEWVIAREILEKYPEGVKASINKRGETALHIAIAANHTHFVEQLIHMNKECLDVKTYTEESGDEGNTAFCYAAISGNVKIAHIMLKKNRDLAMIPGRQNVLPIHIAALHGHGMMVRYLYEETKCILQSTENKGLIDLFVALIDSDMYVSDNQMHEQALELYRLIWEKISLFDDQELSPLMYGNSTGLMFIAAEQGNAQFLATLLSSYPSLAFEVNENGYTIFHIAILHRHMNVFKLIYEIASLKYFVNMKKDKEGNNMLHLAGKLAAPGRQNVVPGAALQLQRDLLLFEEVKEVVLPYQIEEKNERGQTPTDIFIEQHEILIQAGEEWMRNTTNSCMVVATLVATVVFAAAFTIPGGNGQDNGIPIFLNETWFKIFAISDALSLIFSISSILFFLSVIYSRYSIDDFRISLPSKMTLGLLLLFIALVTMMVAFVANFFIIFKHGLSQFAICIPIVAAYLIPVFILQHFRLIGEVIRSTYMPSMFYKRTKNTFF